MATTALQTALGDLELTNGRLTLVRGPDAAAVTLKNKLRFFIGEWFLDTRLGVPYFQYVFVKRPDLDVLRAMFRRVILSVEPIVDVEELTLGPIDADRSCPFRFRARCSDGSVISGASDQPFIVEP